MTGTIRWVSSVIVAVGWIGSSAHGQVLRASGHETSRIIVIPQVLSSLTNPSIPIELTEVEVGVVVVEQVATTTMDISLRNRGGRRQEAVLIMPIPDGGVVRTFAFEGSSSEPTARLLPKDEARKTYDRIVAQTRDPAILEFAGYNLIRSSVFPVEPNGQQKVRLTYEQLLLADGERVDYLLPRSESVDYRVPWKINVRIKSKRPISTVYSPTHQLQTTRKAPGIVSVRLADNARTEPGPFGVSWLMESKDVTASLLAYPDANSGGGYFLLLAGLPADAIKLADDHAIKRELTLVIDRSGSMRGEKVEQVVEAARQIIAGLEEDEFFNIVTYSDTIDTFAETSVLNTKGATKAANTYLDGVRARGGTNIHDALREALQRKPAENTLPIALFLTDGLPTAGQTSEAAIRDLVLKANPHERRAFTVGVGVDVNTPLLEKIAWESRATATFILPGEDVEQKIAQVFKRLSGPVLADARLETLGGEGDVRIRRVQDVMPARLPDMFEGDQLVVLGRYVGHDPITFLLRGNYLGKNRTFRFSFGLNKATTRNGFIPRLWASRKIAMLIDSIRAMGAEPSNNHPGRHDTDPRMKELVDEIVLLSTEFGILTEYTAFLAMEGTDLSQKDQVLTEARRNFSSRAVATRSGLASVNQEMNNVALKQQQVLNRRNDFFDERMNRASIATVQQINDLAFYRKKGRWIDSRVVDRSQETEPTEVIAMGSDRFRELLQRLANEGRQGSVALHGEVLLMVDGNPVLITNAP